MVQCDPTHFDGFGKRDRNASYFRYATVESANQNRLKYTSIEGQAIMTKPAIHSRQAVRKFNFKTQMPAFLCVEIAAVIY